MAMFQQYQSGIQPVSGMAQAGANIGNMYAQGINTFTKGLAEGIKAYNENSAKNDLANQKLQMLSQDVANKIAMYSQDPEIAQSGVLEGLMQTAATLQDAPTKGLNQRIGLVHEAETRLAGFGQQLQEWSFLRGRAIERGISEALNQYAGKVKSTEAVNLDDPNFSVNPNESIVQQKDRVMKYFGEIKKVNPNVQFNDQEFWQRWLAKAEQSTAKAQDIDPRIISAQLEAINAEKGITAQNRLAEGNLPEGAFTEGGMLYQNKDGLYDYQGTPMQNTVKDYEASMQKPSEVPARQEKQYQQDVADALKFFGANDAQKDIEIQSKLAERKVSEQKPKIEENAKITDFAKTVLQNTKDYLDGAIQNNQSITLSDIVKNITGFEIENNPTRKLSTYESSKWGVISTVPFPSRYTEVRDNVAKAAKALGISGDKPMTADQISDLRKAITSQSKSALTEAEKAKEKLDTLSPSTIDVGSKDKAKAPVPVIGVGDVVVGTVDTERPISVNERKAQVQDFLTQRFGAIDPTDPTGKRRIPVQGFDSFFKKAVPESELQEYTTPSGVRLMYMNGKWEQMKMPEQRSIQDIRKEMIGVYGQQTRDGRLVPTEFVPNSGIMIGGLYRGGDAEEKEFKTEMIQLADARRSIKRLQEINDKVGEFANFKLSGEAEVEVMNLKAALRKDIIGVGTVSNFEQGLIDRVIANPTSFFSMESRDRAILLALAQRVDRRIRNLSAAGGLTVQIRDTDSESGRYEELRKRYLKEKYGI